MIFYRLVTGRYASEAWSGSGANQYGGRWNHKGHPAVYVSTSISLASLEILVHVKKDTVLNQYQLFSIDIPDDQIDYLDKNGCPTTGRKTRLRYQRWIWEPAGCRLTAHWRLSYPPASFLMKTMPYLTRNIRHSRMH
jgi:RES domain-containing protein